MRLAKKIYSKYTRTLNDLAFETPAGSFGITKRSRNIILMYHGIDISGKNLFNGRHTPVKYFEKQIGFLAKNYKIVSLKKFFDESSDSTNLCAITFDDGYLNNLTNALPILEKHEAPATFFITGINQTGIDILWADYVNIVSKIYSESIFIDGECFHNQNGRYVSKDRLISLMDVVKKEKSDYIYKQKIFRAFDGRVKFKTNENYFEYWKLLNNEQIVVLSKSKFASIGSHGYYHNNLGNIPISDALEELTNSKNYLENLVQQPVTSIGYPDGSYSDPVSAYAASIGIVHQTCSEQFNKEDDRKNSYLKNRAGIYNFDSAANQLLTALNARL